MGFTVTIQFVTEETYCRPIPTKVRLILYEFYCDG